MPDNSVDSIVTDPPYELGFMGKSWDSTGIANNVDMWKECLRVLKHGGYLLSFGGTRTYHRMACAIEDAGFEIRDQIQWIYGSGFPKSMDISKAIDKQAGVERKVVGEHKHPTAKNGDRTGSKSPYQADNEHFNGSFNITIPTTDLAKQWDGWGTALKPANEPICMARKPLSEKTVAENVLKWGTGGINIDASRIEYEKGGSAASNPLFRSQNGYKMTYGVDINSSSFTLKTEVGEMNINPAGRFPANIILDEEAGNLLDQQSGTISYGNKSGGYNYNNNEYEVEGFVKSCKPQAPSNYGDSGGASRFFYCAKATKKERGNGNNHPTVKPLKLMEYLVKLVTPKNGICLDPFTGSGTTGIATVNSGMRFIGIEQDPKYCDVAKKRIQDVEPKCS